MAGKSCMSLAPMLLATRSVFFLEAISPLCFTLVEMEKSFKHSGSFPLQQGQHFPAVGLWSSWCSGMRGPGARSALISFPWGKVKIWSHRYHWTFCLFVYFCTLGNSVFCQGQNYRYPQSTRFSQPSCAKPLTFFVLLHWSCAFSWATLCLNTDKSEASSSKAQKTSRKCICSAACRLYVQKSSPEMWLC